MAEGRGRVFIVAGEASGDLHGASLIRELKAIDPSLSFFGIGGERMEGEGLDPLYTGSKLSTIGITEAIGRVPHLILAYRRIIRALRVTPPRVAILIDYPEFNLFLARRLKRSGIPVLYFISPQVWAWRRGRVRKIARVVDKMVVILPFEVDIYRQAGVDVEFLGHPLIDDEGLYMEREEARSRLGLTGRAVALLPGSRMKEVKRHLPLMVEVSRRLSQVYRDLSFLLPVAPGIEPSLIRDMIQGSRIRAVEDAFYEVLRASDAGVVASGTATLQAALAGLPMAVVYRVSPLTYWIGRFLVEIDTISLVNIVAGRKVVKEFIQDEATPEAITAEVLNLLNGEGVGDMVKEFERIRDRLGERGVMKRIGMGVYNFINNIEGLNSKDEALHTVA